MPNQRKPEMNLVGIIPARGGSKGIPEKNIAPCAGRPLIAYTCRAALNCASLNRVILSTDDGAIARVGRRLGIEVPFLRPAALSTDRTPMIRVLQHALAWLEHRDGRVDALVLLQPTSPLRTARHIREAVNLFRKTGAATVVSVTEVPHQINPVSLMSMSRGRLVPYLRGRPMPTRRQDKPKLFARNGPAILIIRAEVIRQGHLYGTPTIGYVMDAESSLDVDTPMDLRIVECMMKTRHAPGGDA